MKKEYYGHVLLFTLVYGAMGVLAPLIGQYLKGIGFSGTQIGSVTATGTFVSIFAITFWGNIYNHSPNKRKVVAVVFLMAGVTGLLLMEVRQYMIFLLVFGFVYFFQSATLPLLDAMTLENQQPFGQVRKWGAIGYALAVFFAGKLATEWGSSVIFPMFCIAFMMAIFALYGFMGKGKCAHDLYACAHHESGGIQQDIENTEKGILKNKKAYSELLSNKHYMLLLICTFFVGGTNVANNTYFSFLYIEAGGTLAGVGVTFLLMVGSEALMMAFVEKIERVISLEKMIVIAMAISALRYFWYSTSPAYWMLIATCFAQGIVNGIILVEIVKEIGIIVKPHILGIAVSIYHAICSNCSAILCQYAGGVILDRYGASTVYLFFAAFNLIGVILYMASGLHKYDASTKC
ncbi:MFS transporter [Clostridium aminobutyricum]|uniref:MFS transporter n=1 Tax=Clostridium aminobutyricum TaxID=33953 RepID=A0A939DA15_CLOAM|nr:MFS transporter [Clostridium aminobutyricum]MBN7774154.1 MFS transporter [Clostridium aminobutyricum]